MRKITILFMLCCSTLLSLSAQQEADKEKIRQQINAVASTMKTMQCDFVQTKYLKMLNDKMVSSGKMYYKQSNQLHWEYTTPYTYTFILNDSKVVIRQGEREDVIDVNQSKFFKEIARIMMNSLVGKSLAEQKDFTTAIEERGTEYVATLIPRQKQMQQMFQTLVLHFDKQKSIVSKVELIEKKGDRTVIELKNIKTNIAVDENVFHIH